MKNKFLIEEIYIEVIVENEYLNLRMHYTIQNLQNTQIFHKTNHLINVQLK